MRASNPKMLEYLPLELLEQIISILDEDSRPPSTRLLHEPPSDLLFKGGDPGPLKNLSLTCRSVRSLIAPKMSAYLKVDPDAAQDLADSYRSSSSLEPPQSLVLYLDRESYPEFEPDSKEAGRMQTVRTNVTSMVNVVNPQALTIVASASCLGWLVDHPLIIGDAWVFNLPYQVMRLEQGPFAPSEWLHQGAVHDNHTISTIRPWNHCTYNEGSFIPAYNTYEYHLYIPLSLHQSPMSSELQCHALQLACLVSFKLVAVFPFNHTPSTCRFLGYLPNLEHLTVQLAPPLDCQRPFKRASPGSSYHDFWLENETSYRMLRDHLSFHLLYLSTFTSLDYASPGYRDTIDAVMAHVSTEWTPNGTGTWTRPVESRLFNTSPSRVSRTFCPSLPGLNPEES